MMSATLRVLVLALALGVFSACAADSESEPVEGYPGSILG